jgi:hypothetical protein
MDAATATPTKKTKKSGKARKAPKLTDVPITLAALADRYVHHLAESGKSVGTQFAYRMELNTALEALGAETSISAITTDEIREYFESDRVTKTRRGREKARPTVEKTRRVLRLALAWAAEQGVIEKAPLPEARAHQS